MGRNTKKTEDRMRHRSLSGSRQTLNFGPENINNDHEIEYNVAINNDLEEEDVAVQSSRKLSINRE